MSTRAAVRLLWVICAVSFGLPSLNAQAVRFDSVSSTTSAQCASGKICPISAIPGTQVNICGGTVSTLASCLATPATTYTSATAGTSCATTSQLTPQTGGACLSTSDNQGGFGFWVSPGSYSYFLRVPATAGGGTYGPYPITLGATAGTPAGATVDANYATLALGCSAAGTGTLYVTRAWNALTTAAYACNLYFLGNGKLGVAASNTVTLSGTITAPAGQQIFTAAVSVSSGTIHITGDVPVVYPQWFGAKADGSTDDTGSMTGTQAAVSGTAATIQFNGSYAIGAVSFSSPLSLGQTSLLKVAASSTVSISSPITAPASQQIFDITTNSAAVVSISAGNPVVSASWFGTASTAFAKACSATPSTSTLQVSATTNVSAGFTCARNLQFVAGGNVKPASGQTVTMTVQSAPLQTICDVSASGHCIIKSSSGVWYPEWTGAVADGSTDTGVPLTEIIMASPSGGNISFTARGTYVFSTGSISPNSYQRFTVQAGAMLQINSGIFDIWQIDNTSAFTTTALSASTQGNNQITVGSSSGVSAGQRLIVSAGTFTGSGVEEGPLDFYTVTSVPDGTHINVTPNLRYNYAAFGLPAASPQVHILSSSYVHDVSFVCYGGGGFTHSNTSTGWYIGIKYTENIEIAGCAVNGYGNAFITGGEVQNLNWHDTTVTGSASYSGNASVFNVAALTQSSIRNNIISMDEVSSDVGHQNNHIVPEVACHDNFVSGNNIGPIASPGSAAIEFALRCFNNTVIGNTIWGTSADVTANTATLGVRTPLAISGVSGDVIEGNIFHNVTFPITDNLLNSAISGNNAYNDSTSSSSICIQGLNANYGTFSQNSCINFTRIQAQTAGGSPGVPTIVSGAGIGTGTTKCAFDGYSGGTYASNTVGMVECNSSGDVPTASSTVFTVTFAAPVPGTHAYCTISPINNNALQLSGTQQVIPSQPPNATTFSVTSGSATLGTSVGYQWIYKCNWSGN